MSGRGTDLMNRARGHLAEATELVGMVTEAELGAMCPDRSGDAPGRTVAAVAAHLAEGYDRLGRFLQNRLAAGTTSARPLADLTDQQLDSVPDGRSTPFSDGRRTLAEVLDAAIAHQGEHLAALKRAVG